MDKPLLSIVITQHGPDYAIHNYFDINQYSLFSHVHEPIEILIAEDFEDNKPKYITELRKKGLNISYVFSEKQGVANNRTNGLFHATGKYVTFVDSPDTLDFIFKDLFDLLSTDYDIITYTTNLVQYDIFTIPNIWGKFFKTDLLKRLGGFYYSWNGWWEEGTSQAVLRYNRRDMNVRHLALKSDKIIYTWLNNSVHTVSHFPTKKEILSFLEKSKSDFYPHKNIIYYEHLEYIGRLIDCNHDIFEYDYSEITEFCNAEKKLIEAL